MAELAIDTLDQHLNNLRKKLRAAKELLNFAKAHHDSVKTEIDSVEAEIMAKKQGQFNLLDDIRPLVTE